MLLFGKNVKFGNIKIKNDEENNVLHINKLEIEGFDMSFYNDFIPKPFQIDEGKEAKKEIIVETSPIEEEEVIIQPEVLDEHQFDSLLFDDLGNSIVYSYPKDRPISWNQNTTLFLLLNNKTACTSADFLEALTLKGIPSSNWVSNVKRFFIISGETIKRREGTEEEYKNRLNVMNNEIKNSIMDLHNFLSNFKKKDSISSLQIFHTLTLLLKEKEISLDRVYEYFKTNNVPNANFMASISSKLVKYFIVYNQHERKLSLYQGGEFLHMLTKHQELFKIKIVREKTEPKEITSREKTTSKEKKLLGKNSVVTSDENVIINYSRNHFTNDSESRRDFVTLIIACLKHHGVTSVKRPSINNSLVVNNMAPMQLPRDISKSENIVFNSKNKTYDLNENPQVEKIINGFLSYKLIESDLTKKSLDLLPILSKFIKEDVYPRRAFSDECKKANLTINIPRDLPLIFGCFDKENFYPCKHRILEAQKLSSQKKK